MHKLTKYLIENKKKLQEEESLPIRKAIFADARSGRLNFGFENENSFVDNVSYKEWLKSPLRDESNDYMKSLVVRACEAKITQFNKRIELNDFIRKMGAKRNFFKIMEWFEKNNIKVDKKGIASPAKHAGIKAMVFKNKNENNILNEGWSEIKNPVKFEDIFFSFVKKYLKSDYDYEISVEDKASNFNVLNVNDKDGENVASITCWISVNDLNYDTGESHEAIIRVEITKGYHTDKILFRKLEEEMKRKFNNKAFFKKINEMIKKTVSEPEIEVVEISFT